MSHGNFKIKRIAATSILCFSVLYSNTAFAVWPVTEEVLTPYVMGHPLNLWEWNDWRH